MPQYFWRCFTIFVIAVLNNYWHCFQLYSCPCFCTVLFSAIFQLYSWSYYCPVLFPPFPALFPALLLYSFNPGHVTVQHYSQPFQVLFPSVLLYSFITSHLFAVRGLFIAVNNSHLFAVCGLFIAVKTIIIFFSVVQLSPVRMGPLGKPPALPSTSTLSRASSHMRSHPSTLQTPTPLYTIRVW